MESIRHLAALGGILRPGGLLGRHYFTCMHRRTRVGAGSGRLLMPKAPAASDPRDTSITFQRPGIRSYAETQEQNWPKISIC